MLRPRILLLLLSLIPAQLVWSQEPPPALRLTLLAEGFTDPTQIVSAYDDTGRLFVVEQPGTIRIVSAETGEIDPTPFLDIRSKVYQRQESCCDEEGLLGLTFPLDGGPKDHFFVFYVTPDRDVIIARFEIDPLTGRADHKSEKILQTVPHPLRNHFGGTIAFSPDDGLLYMGIGDGSTASTVEEAQNPESLLGKILRYNPYDPEAKLEVVAYGVRNPWRISFDDLTGDLYFGDVGENRFEEVNFLAAPVVPGTNFGWGVMEGYACFDFIPCDSTGMTPPIFAYDHNTGCSVTGGQVYRGYQYPELYGKYIFGDLCTGRIWESHRDEAGDWTTSLLLDKDEDQRVISSFGQDQNGELYFAEYIRGQVFRIEGAPSNPDPSASRKRMRSSRRAPSRRR